MPSRPALSAAVITLDDEVNLARWLDSLQGLASEIVVVDSGSKDRTAEVARAAGARFEVSPWAGYAGQMNKTLRLCTNPWVLCLDADEALSPELARTVDKVTTSDPGDIAGVAGLATFAKYAFLLELERGKSPEDRGATMPPGSSPG